MNKHSLNDWIYATRAQTLVASVCPVLIGIAMAFGDGVHHWATAILCLLAAAAIQLGTNMANDYYDFQKGADTKDMRGPISSLQAGMFKPEEIKLAFILSFLFAVVLGVILVLRGGIPILLIGIVSILSGLFYTAGPRPLGYMGLGDLFVLIFFGPVATAGTYYVQSFEINFAVILAGFAPGLLSVGILTVNNLRDINTDRKVGKRTLVVRFGRSFALYEYLFVMITAALIPVMIYYLIEDHKAILICSLILFIAIPTIKTVLTTSEAPLLNKALERTAKLVMIYSVLFSIAWII